MKKVIRDGLVAILYSPGYGAGWYTWNDEHPQCIYSPEIVELVEQGKRSEITEELCDSLFGERFYHGGARSLQIEWLPVGTQFLIDEHDGNETIQTFQTLTLTA